MRLRHLNDGLGLGQQRRIVEGRIEHKRFLAQHLASVLQRLERLGRVAGRRRADVDDAGAHLAQQGAEIGVDRTIETEHRPELVGAGLRALRRPSQDRCHPGALDAPPVRMMAPNAARSKHCHGRLHRILPFVSRLPTSPHSG